MPAPIPGTEGGFHPFFSPDGLWVGFFAGGKLKKVPLAGGTPQVLADAPNPWGATWGTDGTIVFNPQDCRGLWRVPAIGGTPEKLASPDYEQGDWYLNWPEFLPDGEAVLFTNCPGDDGRHRADRGPRSGVPRQKDPHRKRQLSPGTFPPDT